MAYPDTLLRGLITPGSVTQERYVTSEAFLFQDFRKNRSDNYNELSINWEDSDEAVDVLLNQKKEGTEDPQFKIGFARMSLSRIKDVLKPHISDKTYSFERKPIDGNPYHGNLLADAKLPRQIVKNIQHSLATIATADVYLRSDENIKYLKKEHKTMPKVSVLVPVYGVEKYIERCARSLFEQTLDDIEFIFVDDCTPDRSIEILKSVIEKYRLRLAEKKYDVRIERMPTNSGLAAVRRHGIQLATGDYIINCDSDDWVDVTMYEKMYHHAIQHNSDLVICDYIISNGHKESEKVFRKNISDCSRYEVFKRLLTSSALNNVWSAMAKRDLFEDMMFPVGAMSEDKTIMIQLAWKAQKITYLPEALYYYFMSENSIVRTRNLKSNFYKFEQSMGNRTVILDFIKREKIDIPENLIIPFLFAPKIGLIEDYLNDNDCRNKWMNTYPISTWNILTNEYISLKEKIKYLLCYLYALLYITNK